MAERNFKIYRSSAGSGKTYTLTKEYLKLALRSPHYYKSILAVTFTNKATQEMKSRIIFQLFAIINGNAGTMLSELSLAVGLDEDALKERAQQVLTNILHGYSYFSVSTIDSFFQKVIRSFAREIGLHSGFSLELDQKKVLEDVIDNVLKDVGIDKQLTRWLVQFAEDKVENGTNWDFRNDIRSLAYEIFQEHYKTFEKDIAAAAAQKDFIPKLLGKLKNITSSFEATMKACGEEALKIIEARALDVADFSSGKRGVMGYLEKITLKNDFDPKVMARKALGFPENWHTKTSKKKEQIISAVVGGLDDCLRKAIETFDKEHQQYESARQVMRFMYTFGILADITKKLQEYREENDLMLISDAALFLKDIVGDNEAPFIYEKIGTTYRHYLIDEFQDTSGFQWENFRPLVKNSLAEGNTNLVVGDVKQSIYRWRGGDWQLLLDKIVDDIGEYQTEELNLNQNWRSRKNIIHFNNKLFAGTPSILEAICQSDLSDIADERLAEFLKEESRKISTAYKDVFQEFPVQRKATDKDGYVNISFIPSREGVEEESDDPEIVPGVSGWKSEVLKRIPAMVEDFQDKGYALKDIAFLVRNKRYGKLIADWLLTYKSLPEARAGYKYEVISSESLMIGSAVSVNMILNTLRYFDNPQDMIARVNMVHDYQVYICRNEGINLHQLYAESVEEAVPYQWLPDSFTELTAKLTGYPLYEIVETIISVFKLQNLSGEYAYMQAFQDAVLEYGKKERADISSFLKWWDEQGYNNAVQISDATDAMKILTIHKSKGLQFKVVIIPFCDWKIDHDPLLNNTLWCCSDVSPFNEIPYLPLKYSGSLKSTIYRQSYYQEMVKAYMDALNLLYVAFTRAEDCLLAFGELPKIEKTGEVKVKRVSDLLFQFLNDPEKGCVEKEEDGSLYLQQYWDAKEYRFEFGAMHETTESTDGEGDNVISLQNYPSSSWRNSLSIKPRARNLFMETDSPVAEKINYGLLMHEILAEIKFKSDLPHVLRSFLFDGIISEDESKVLEAKLHTVLNHPDIQDWFDPVWEIKTEVPVLPLSGKINRLDRVMLKDKLAVVVDFKSGDVQSTHKSQVRHYSSLLADMGYEKVEGYIVYLDPVEIMKVI